MDAITEASNQNALRENKTDSRKKTQADCVVSRCTTNHNNSFVGGKERKHILRVCKK